MKRLKQVLSLLCALALCLSCGTGGLLAAETMQNPSDLNVLEPEENRIAVASLTSYNEATDPAIVVSDASIMPGESVTLTVTLKNNPGIAGLRLFFDLPDGFTVKNVTCDATTYTMTFDKSIVLDASSDYNGEVLLTVELDTDEDMADGGFLIGFDVAECFDAGFSDVELYSAYGTVTVWPYLFGDATGDGEIDVRDVVLMRQYVASLDRTIGLSDVDICGGGDANGDGVCDTKDIVLLRQYIVNINPQTGVSDVALGLLYRSPQSVTLNKTSLALWLGRTEKLTATVLPEESINKNVIWSSSDTAVATVSSDGTVTAVGEGTAVITATTVSGCKKASCTVSVLADGVYDFGGEEFYFSGSFIPKALRDYTQQEINNGEVPASYSLSQEAMMNKVLATEDKLNCIIHMTALPSGDYAEMATVIASGQIEADLLYFDSTLNRQLYMAGLLADLNEVEAIDLTDEAKWGTADSLARTQYKGAQYGIPEIGSRYYPFQSFFYGILIQKNEAFASYETDWTVWELAETGRWTFDTFLDCLADVGSYDNWDPKYSLGLNGTSLYDAALAVNEASRVVYDEEAGKYVYGLTTDAAVEAINFARSVYQVNTVNPNSNSLNAFSRNEYTFWLSNGYRVLNDIANITTDFSWLPFPYGPHSVYGVSTAAYGRSNAECVVSILKGGVNDENPDEETQKNGVVFNELFGEISIAGYDTTEDYIKDLYFDQIDARSFNVYKSYAANVHSPYRDELGENLSSTINSAIQNILNDTSVNARTALATLEDDVNTQLDSEMN